MDESCSAVLAQIADLRRILVGLEERCALASAEVSIDADLLTSTKDSLLGVAAGLSEIENQVQRHLDSEGAREENWFRQIADVLPVGVFKLLPEGTVVYANAVALKMFGYEGGGITPGLSIADLAEPDELARMTARMAQLAAGEPSAPSKYRLKRGDGSTIMVEALGSPELDAAGRMVGFWGTLRDVTFEHRTEEIAHARTQLRIGLASVPDLEQAMEMVLGTALLLEGLDSGCVYESDPESSDVSLVARKGFTDDRICTIALRAAELVLRSGLEPEPVVRCITLDREEIMAIADSQRLDNDLRSLLVVPMWHEQRPVAVMVLGSHSEERIPGPSIEAVEEMVETVAAVIARIRAEEARAQAVETFEALFRTAPLALYVLDLEGRVLMWNQAASRVFGWSESEVIGHLPPFLDQTQMDEFRGNLERSLKGPGLQGMEFVRRRRDGSDIHVRISAAALHDSKGNPIGAMAIAEDVSEEKRAEQTKLRIGRLEALGVLAGGVAHDFNNVLMVIMGNLSLARMEQDQELRTELLDEAQDAATKAVALTARLVTFAKGGAPVKEVVDLQEIVTRVTDRVLGGTSIETEIDLRATSPVEADPVQLREALRGIVANAKEAMQGGGRLTVSTDDFRDSDGARYVRISVADTGPGIEPELRDRIFDPYFSTKPAGAGLGLSAAHSVVSQHGGRIELESTPGLGAAFHVFIPAKPGTAGPDTGAASEAGQVDESHRVLVVDDEDMVRALLERMLGRLGYVVVTCASGEEAIEVYRTAMESGEGFAVVITDLTMPKGIGGIETARALLEIDSDARVVVSSGYSDDPAVAQYQDFGFIGSVRKPYSLDALREALEKAIRRGPVSGQE